MTKQKAALYIRVSTHHQVDKDSLPLQRKDLIAYSKHVLNIDDYEIFEDAGFSGKDTDRPKYQEMIKRIRNKEFTHLLVWKIDRISRNLIDFTKMYEELKDYGVTFVSKNEQFDTSSAMGEAMLKIILVFAELERKLAAERVYATMLSRAEKGLWNGAPTPLGYDYDEETEFPEVNEVEAKTVRFIFDEYIRTKSAGEVKQSLERKGYRTKRDGNWTTKTIGDVLQNPFYIGTYRYNYRYSPHGKIRPKSEWIVVEDNHTPIVSKEKFDLCEDIRKNNLGYLEGARKRKKYTHVFSGLLTCPICNLRYVASRDRKRNDGYAPSQYRCTTYVRNKKEYATCHNLIGEVVLGPFIFQYLFNLMDGIELIKNSKSMDDSKLERVLLSGEEFKEIAGIVTEDLNNTFKNVLNKPEDTEEGKKDKTILDKSKAKFQTEQNKLTRALDRLENLFLFSDDSMSEKDYLIKKQELNDKLSKLKNEFKSEYKEIERNEYTDLNFFEKSTKYLIMENVLDKDINYNDMIKYTDKNVIKAYVNTVIKNIDINDKKVTRIEFTNGLVHRFIYK